jgi:L-rhamnose isomerase
MPFSAVWDMLCLRADVPAGTAWIGAVQRYERTALSKRK